MNMVQRVQDILLKPKETWPAIDAEPATPASIYQPYLLVLAAIPAVAGLIGMSLIGIGGFGVSLRVPFVTGLAQAVLSYGLTLVMIYVLAWLVHTLASNFNAQGDFIAALKLVAYASTAALVGGVFSLIPALGVLGLLASLYSIYLLYLGVPVMMKCPEDKTLVYTVVIVVCGIFAGFVLGMLSALMTPGMGPSMMMGR